MSRNTAWWKAASPTQPCWKTVALLYKAPTRHHLSPKSKEGCLVHHQAVMPVALGGGKAELGEGGVFSASMVALEMATNVNSMACRIPPT